MNVSRLFIPKLGGLYQKLDEPSVALLRVICGVALMTHGWGKIQDPMSMVGFVEGMGFWPGQLWAPLLACSEFIGGFLIAIGFLTRVFAFTNLISMTVVIWFHWILQEQGYAGAEKPILWWFILLYFFAHGAPSFSVDKLMKKEF